MIANKLELDIISLYDHNLKSLFSIHQISKKLNKRYPYINKKVNDLINSNILRKIIIGRSHLCTINLANDHTRLLLTSHELEKKQKFLASQKTDIDGYIESIRKRTLIHCVLAVPTKDTHKLVFVCEDKNALKDIAKESDVFTRDEFIAYLAAQRTQLFENRIVLYGYERFFEMITEIEEDLNKLYAPF